MCEELRVEAFFERRRSTAVIDVRSPAEYQRGHIPCALNVPLFSDDERAQIGLCYKHKGREEAVLLGLDLVGPKMRRLASQIRAVSETDSPIVHCWRGGMRSSSVAWLLRQVGMIPRVLRGGYKSFRAEARREFAATRQIIVLSGLTGAGKTKVLQRLALAGEQVLDLEHLAHHRGSSFGGIGLPPQPTCEQFENHVFMVLRDFDAERPVWIEDESPSIGKVRVPDELWWAMRRSTAVFLDVDRHVRANNLAEEYGSLDLHELGEAIGRLQRKLGGLATKQATELLHRGELREVAFRLLAYYDKTYHHAATKRPRAEVHRIDGEVDVPELIRFGHAVSLGRAVTAG